MLLSSNFKNQGKQEWLPPCDHVLLISQINGLHLFSAQTDSSRQTTCACPVLTGP